MSVESQLAALTPEAMEEAVDIGQQFNDDEVLDQVVASLAEYDRTSPDLGEQGFTAEDVQDLRDLEPALRTAGMTRTGALTGTRAGKKAYQNAVTAGKGAFRRAVTVLTNTADFLARRPDASNPTAANLIAVHLGKVGRLGRAGTRVSKQLDDLKVTLANEAVAKAAATRGGPTAKTAVDNALAALQASRPAYLASPGTPTQTRQQNLLEGVSVLLLRSLRKAARERAKQTGDAAFAKGFELSKLYAPESKPSPATPPAPNDAVT